MKYYTEEEIARSIAVAVEKTNTLLREENRIVSGLNDCISLIFYYEEALRGTSKLKELTTKGELFKEQPDLYRLFDKLGFTDNPEELINRASLDLISENPRFGDIAFRNGTFMIENHGCWISVQERRRIVGVVNSVKSNHDASHGWIIARPYEEST